MKTTKSDRTKIIQDCLLVNEQNRLLCKRNWVKITANMQIAIVSFYRFRKVESFVLQLVKVNREWRPKRDSIPRKNKKRTVLF